MVRRMNLRFNLLFSVRLPPFPRWFLTVLFLALLTACVQEESGKPEHKALPTIARGVQVSLEYTLKLGNQQVYDTNRGKEPLVFVHGDGQVVPGLEMALEGMMIGEQKYIVVPPEQGYGELRTTEVTEIPKELIAPDARQVGAQLKGLPRHGRQVLMHVKEVKEDMVVVDFNHPLAGKTLFFDIKVLDVQAVDLEK